MSQPDSNIRGTNLGTSDSERSVDTNSDGPNSLAEDFLASEDDVEGEVSGSQGGGLTNPSSEDPNRVAQIHPHPLDSIVSGNAPSLTSSLILAQKKASSRSDIE